MYSTKKNIQQLLSLMEQHGVTDVVLSPGSRNMPLAQSFAAHPSFTCHAVTDERSAGFFAIGLALNKKRPTAVCVTSGSALLNLASAVSEAYYQQVPLLVISADRPAAWIGQMDGQTIPQTGVFGTLVRKDVSLPEPANGTDLWHCNRLINDALLELNHRVCGPVHINVPISEPFFDCSATEIETERAIRRGLPDIDNWRSAKRQMVIVGQMQKNEAEQLKPTLSKLGCPILCEHISNLGSHPNFISNADLILNSTDTEQITPDLVIYFGGHIVSKRIKNFIRAAKPHQCWRVDAEGACTDTFQCATHIIEMQPKDFLQMLTPVNRNWLETWQKASAAVEAEMQKMDFGHTPFGIVKRVLEQIPQQSALVLANSSMVRYAQLFSLNANVEVLCNRGVNGIDGTLSTAVGYASANPDRKVFVLVGDLSFFYDMNALWQTNLPQNLRIVLINNGCGEIFRVLPGLPKNVDTERYVMASHNTSAKGWAESLKIDYQSARTVSETEKCIELIIKSPKTALAEFFTNPATDESVFNNIQKIKI